MTRSDPTTAGDEAAVEAWFASLEDGASTLARQVSSIVGADERLRRAVKWGRLTFTAEDDWHHWVCAVAAPRAGVKLVFHKGVLLDDPAGLLRGSARYVREMAGAEAVGNAEAVRALVRDALAHQTDLLD